MEEVAAEPDLAGGGGGDDQSGFAWQKSLAYVKDTFGCGPGLYDRTCGPPDLWGLS